MPLLCVSGVWMVLIETRLLAPARGGTDRRRAPSARCLTERWFEFAKLSPTSDTR